MAPKDTPLDAQSPTGYSVVDAHAERTIHRHVESDSSAFNLSIDLGEDDDDDLDSTFGGSAESEIVSVQSSLYEAVEENGRTYHNYKQGAYYLPNDEAEQERLDLQHLLFVETFNGKLNLAPIENPRAVLDICTGTGLWAMEFASQNPSASVIGTDLSPIQPHYVPPNCQFEIDDVEDEWLFGHSFDYIHGRMLITCFKNPKAVFQRAFDALEPGGYFEVQDVYFKSYSIDGTSDGTAFAEWMQTLVDAAKTQGRDWHCVLNYKRWFEEVGFTDVVQRRFHWPLNTWARGEKMKRLGTLMCQNSLEGVSSISLAIMTRVLGMSVEEVEETLKAVRRDIKDRSIHAYIPVFVVYGRKPS